MYFTDRVLEVSSYLSDPDNLTAFLQYYVNSFIGDNTWCVAKMKALMTDDIYFDRVMGFVRASKCSPSDKSIINLESNLEIQEDPDVYIVVSCQLTCELGCETSYETSP